LVTAAESWVSAHVGGVDAAPFLQRRGDAEQLVEVGEDAGRVAESGGQADGALVERGAHQVGHGGGLRRRDRPRRPALDGGAHGAVADQLGDVERQAAALQRRQVAGHVAPGVVEIAVVQHASDLRQQRAVAVEVGRRRAAAVAGDDGGDALLEQRRQHRAVIGLRDHPVAVRVHVDETRRHHPPAAVERSRRRRAGQVADRGDAAVAHADRSRHGVAPGAVENGAAVEDEVEGHGGR
jgi:hypothetical protein